MKGFKKLKRINQVSIVRYLPILLILLSISIIVGSTFAYFTDTKDEVSNLTFSKVELSSETTTGIKGTLRDVIPGTKLVDGALKFSKSIDSEPIFVRAKVSFSLPELYKDDVGMLQILDALRKSTDFNIVGTEQNNALWSEKEGNYFYLMDASEGIISTNLKYVDTIDTYLLTNELVVPRDLKQLDNNAQYMKEVNFHVAFEAIQADNISTNLSDVKTIFNTVFPLNASENFIEDADDGDDETQTTVTVYNSDGSISHIVEVGEEGLVDNIEYVKSSEAEVFKGWYLDESFTTAFEFGTVIDSSISLFPKVLKIDPNMFEYSGNTITGYIGQETDIIVPSSYSIDGTITIETVFEDDITLYNYLMDTFESITIVDSNGDTYTCNYSTNYYEIMSYAYPVKNSIVRTNYVYGNDYQVTTIGIGAFYEAGLTSIVVQEGITTIKSVAFRQNTYLTSLELPSTITSIENARFVEDCRNLTTIIVHEDNPNYYMDGQCLISRVNNSLLRGLSGAVIPDYVVKIEDNACMMAELGIVNIPEGVTTIGNRAFYVAGITKLTLPSTLKTIGDEAFGGTSPFEVYIPHGVTTIGQSAFRDCPNLIILEIPSTVSSIGTYTFADNKKLMRITNLSGRSLSNLTAVTDQQIRTSKSTSFTNDIVVENGFIYYTTGSTTYLMAGDGTVDTLTNEYLDGVTNISDSAFQNTAFLKSVVITKHIILGNNVFNNCSSLQSVTLSDNMVIPKETFQYCINLETVILGANTTIENYAFYSCSKLTNINFNNIVSVGEYAFAYCDSLVSCELNNITDILGKAFYSCDNLEKVVLGDKVVSIGSYAFYDCEKLTEIKFNNVSTINNYAFGGTNLNVIKIGTSVTTITNSAFNNCLAYLLCENSTVASIVIGKGNTKVYVLDNVTDFTALEFTELDNDEVVGMCQEGDITYIKVVIDGVVSYYKNYVK